MSFPVHSAVMQNYKAVVIDVEVSFLQGIPELVIVGLPSKMVTEAKERLRAVFQALHIKRKYRRTIINLAPADIPKAVSHLDLALFVALLIQQHSLPIKLQQAVFIGELSLDGSLKASKGLASLVTQLVSQGYTRFYFPASNQAELSFITGVELFPLQTVRQLLTPLTPLKISQSQPLRPCQFQSQLLSITPWNGVKTQLVAKRALAIALAGKHHTLILGPPGVGKTELLAFTRWLQPTLSGAEDQELQIRGQSSQVDQLNQPPLRPYRVVPTSITPSQLVGSIGQKRKGEVILAHRGILVLDEILLMKKKCLEALLSPLENGLYRGDDNMPIPASFLLLAASNLCPCGFRGTGVRPCTCSAARLQSFRTRLSAGFQDRLQLWVRVSLPLAEDLQTAANPTRSEMQQLACDIAQARNCQLARYQDLVTNGEVSAQLLLERGEFSSQALERVRELVDYWHLSARSYFNLLRVARSIADLEQLKIVSEEQVLEAIAYHPVSGWGS